MARLGFFCAPGAQGLEPLANRMGNAPFFIGGPDRCGKTMLRAFLVSHSRLSIPAIGSNLWTYFYGQYGDLRRADNFERCLAAMLRYKHVKFLRPDAARIRREFWQGTPSYARLFALFQQHYAERAGKPRWGDQSGLIERYADPIFAAYPDAKILHMVRDPRDRYEASLAKWEQGKARAGGATARWLYSIRLAERNLRRYPRRYLTVRYEMLVSETEATLRRVCDFLEEEFEPTMLTLDGAPGYRAKLLEHVPRTVGAPEPNAAPFLTTAYIGRFRGRVPPGEIAFIQLFAGREMQRLGYALEPIRLTGSDRLRFSLVERQANLARLMAWYGLETLQHNFPGLAGRIPSANKLT